MVKGGADRFSDHDSIQRDDPLAQNISSPGGALNVGTRSLHPIHTMVFWLEKQVPLSQEIGVKVLVCVSCQDHQQPHHYQIPWSVLNSVLT